MTDPLVVKVLGPRVRSARERANISQRELARRMNVTNSFISHIEAGAKSPSLMSLRALAVHLGVTTDHLLGLSG